MKKIYVSDITLKEITKGREATLLFREKTAIANSASALGADAIELPEIKKVREDTIIYKTIAASVRDSVVALPIGFSKEGAEAAWECIKDAAKPRLQVVLPTATATMEYKYHLKAEKMLPKIEELIGYAKELCDDVEFVALDATRAESEFLCECLVCAEKAGATCVTVCDDAGISLPEEIGAMVKALVAKLSVPVYVEVSDNINMAVAVALSAISAGASGVKCALAGKGALSMGALSDAISARGESFGVSTSLKNTQVHTSTEELLHKIAHEEVASENSFDAEKSSILLSGESSISDVADAARVLGYDLTEEDSGNVHTALLQVCEKKGSVGAREFEALIASFAMQAPSKYHLESYMTNCTNLANSMSQVTLRTGDEILCGVSTGDGPIDSVFRAIEQCIGHHYELDDFQIQSVTEGKEALGTALVRLRSEGKLYSGNGISEDIVAASIRAYLNALNKIVFEEK